MKPHEPQTKFVSAILSILAVVLLAGCSSRPSESTGRAVLQNAIATESKGMIKLVSFRKTNGTGGGTYYHMEYEAQIEFSATGTWYPLYLFTVGQVEPPPPLGHNVSAGHRETVQGSLSFEKTERGWRGQDGNVY